MPRPACPGLFVTSLPEQGLEARPHLHPCPARQKLAASGKKTLWPEHALRSGEGPAPAANLAETRLHCREGRPPVLKASQRPTQNAACTGEGTSSKPSPGGRQLFVTEEGAVRAEELETQGSGTQGPEEAREETWHRTTSTSSPGGSEDPVCAQAHS